MKPVALFAGSSLAFLVLASIPVACVSSNASPNEDSGAPPGQDGAPPSEDAAPSGSDATLPDAGTDAPEKDSATEDAGPQPLTVHVLLGLAPESGVLVVFQDASGAVVSSATTDATGSVSQLVTAGSQVTVALGTTLAPRLVTIQAVEPGDVLTLVDTPPASTLAENVNVTLPAPTWDASGATEYVYAAQCGTSAGSPVYVNPDCQLNGQFPLLAYAQASGGQELAYTYQTGNALLEDGGTDAITVTRPWATSSVVEQLTTSSLPAGITGDVQFT
jgi:hypothetical protein